MKYNELIKALVDNRNTLAQEINTEGAALLEKRAELESSHKSDCPCRKTGTLGGEPCTDDTFKSGMADIEARILEQKKRRDQLISYDESIEAGEEVSEKALEAAVAGVTGPVTSGGMMIPNIEGLYPAKKETFFQRFGNDFHSFLGKTGLLKSEDIKSRGARATYPLKNGDKFNCAASFYGTFGSQQRELRSASKSLGLEIGKAAEIEAAVGEYREAVKSMFTQVPGQSGGDGSLYAPTAVFAGNTGGLCEYIIDDDVELLPYPPVSFLSCIPVRRISKSYVLYVRQTLRINNASGVGESVVLSAANPTGIEVDFRPIKPESEFGFSQARANTITFADTLAVSEEFLEDCPSIADAVETQLMENVRQEFYDQLINGDGSGGEYPELTGLLALVGLSTRIHRGAASFMGNVMMPGVATDNTRETIERAIFDAQAYGYNVDCVLMSHDDFVEMTFLKDADGYRLYTDTELGSVRGAKIVYDIRMPAGVAIAGAFRQTVRILLRRAVRLDIGWVDNQFREDMLTLRATMRGGLVAKVPHALIRITGI